MQDLTPEDLLELTPEEVRTELTAEDVHDRLLTEPEVRHIVQAYDAFWLHPGNPQRPHVELASKRCSNGYINLRPVLRNSNLCHLFGRQLDLLIRNANVGRVDIVVGSYRAAIGLAHSVSIWLGCKFDFTRKEITPDGQTIQVWDSDQRIGTDELVLHVEELVTTTETARKVREGIARAHEWPIRYAPVIPVAVHRSNSANMDGSRFLQLAHYDIADWAREECPLCAQGSERLQPKEGGNWARLMGEA